MQAPIPGRIVSQVAGSGYRTTLWFTPPTEAAFIREWLGLNEPQPALFRGLPGQIRRRAAVEGLSLRVLRPLREVRTLQDARVLGLLKSQSTIDRT